MASLHNKANLWLSVDLLKLRLKDEDLARAMYRNIAELDSSRNDIAGIQITWENNKCLAIVYCATIQAKAIILAASQIILDGVLLSFKEFTENFYIKPERISIHGIPLHISNDEIEGWIAEKIDLTCKVNYHVKKVDGFSLLTGNRYAYGYVKRDCVFPRHHKLPMSSPFDENKLIDFNVTVYITSQPINCAKCYSLAHNTNECDSQSKKPARGDDGGSRSGDNQTGSKDEGKGKGSANHSREDQLNGVGGNKEKDAHKTSTELDSNAKIENTVLKPSTLLNTGSVRPKVMVDKAPSAQTKSLAQARRNSKSLKENKDTTKSIQETPKGSEKRPHAFTPPSTEKHPKSQKHLITQT